MPVTEAEARPDSPTKSAYDRYVDANAAHTLICANPNAPAGQRFDAAMAVHAAFHDFLLTGAPTGVPAEPTSAMIDAGLSTGNRFGRKAIANIWRVMHRAAVASPERSI